MIYQCRLVKPNKCHLASVCVFTDRNMVGEDTNQGGAEP